MRQTIRPVGAGKDGSALAFGRSMTSPSAGLVLQSAAEMPGDWPTSPQSGNIEDSLGHALGWTLEIRRRELLLLNPLGEGLIKADLPDLDEHWLQNVRADGSCAAFLVPLDTGSTTVDGLIKSAAGIGRAATIRTAVADDYGKVDPVGRNEPCPCGSGKKFKHCCG